MRGMSRAAIKCTTIKRWLETMNIPHKKISGEYIAIKFCLVLNCPTYGHYTSLGFCLKVSEGLFYRTTHVYLL